MNNHRALVSDHLWITKDFNSFYTSWPTWNIRRERMWPSSSILSSSAPCSTGTHTQTYNHTSILHPSYALAVNKAAKFRATAKIDKISIHSSLNFFIYCFASKRFRASLRTFLAPLVPPKRPRETISSSNLLPMSETSPLNQNEWSAREQFIVLWVGNPLTLPKFKVQSPPLSICQSMSVANFEYWNLLLTF